jgi:hypothetical protein
MIGRVFFSWRHVIRGTARLGESFLKDRIDRTAMRNVKTDRKSNLVAAGECSALMLLTAFRIDWVSSPISTIDGSECQSCFHLSPAFAPRNHV